MAKVLFLSLGGKAYNLLSSFVNNQNSTHIHLDKDKKFVKEHPSSFFVVDSHSPAENLLIPYICAESSNEARTGKYKDGTSFLERLCQKAEINLADYHSIIIVNYLGRTSETIIPLLSRDSSYCDCTLFLLFREVSMDREALVSKLGDYSSLFIDLTQKGILEESIFDLLQVLEDLSLERANLLEDFLKKAREMSLWTFSVLEVSNMEEFKEIFEQKDFLNEDIRDMNFIFLFFCSNMSSRFCLDLYDFFSGRLGEDEVLYNKTSLKTQDSKFRVYLLYRKPMSSPSSIKIPFYYKFALGGDNCPWDNETRELDIPPFLLKGKNLKKLF